MHAHTCVFSTCAIETTRTVERYCTSRATGSLGVSVISSVSDIKLMLLTASPNLPRELATEAFADETNRVPSRTKRNNYIWMVRAREKKHVKSDRARPLKYCRLRLPRLKTWRFWKLILTLLVSPTSTLDIKIYLFIEKYYVLNFYIFSNRLYKFSIFDEGFFIRKYVHQFPLPRGGSLVEDSNIQFLFLRRGRS